MSNRNIKPIKLIPELVQLIVVDSFCGAGGFTEGVEQAVDADNNRLAIVVAGINHDALAIASHAKNHPETAHFVEDVRDRKLPYKILAVVKKARKSYPNARLLFHASLECTHFSDAAGGRSRDADSRSLAGFMPNYLHVLNPDIFTIENVREFMSWGDLVPKVITPQRWFENEAEPIGGPYCPLSFDKKTNQWGAHWVPDSRNNGKAYQRWIRLISDMGYRHEHRLMNSADFGAYTSRLRYFGIFAKSDVPVVWPQPTHSKKVNVGLFGGLKPWKAVRDVLEFSDKGRSIFGRKTPLVEKSLERIYAGLVKHLAGGDESFLLKYLSNDAVSGVNDGISISEPCSTISTQNRLGIIQVETAQKHFLSKYYSGDPDSKNITVEGPSGALTCTDSHALVTTDFLSSYYGNGSMATVDEPAGTLTTKDRMALVQCKSFIYSMQHNNAGSSLDRPAPTLLTGNHHYLLNCEGFLMNPGWFGHSGSLENPSPTLIARQDKSPVSLVVTESGELAIEVLETDSPATRKIKRLMAAYGIVDILMRMLKVAELKLIQGFPASYILMGNQTHQKKFIGNSVVPPFIKAWMQTIGLALRALHYS